MQPETFVLILGLSGSVLMLFKLVFDMVRFTLPKNKTKAELGIEALIEANQKLAQELENQQNTLKTLIQVINEQKEEIVGLQEQNEELQDSIFNLHNFAVVNLKKQPRKKVMATEETFAAIAVASKRQKMKKYTAIPEDEASSYMDMVKDENRFEFLV